MKLAVCIDARGGMAFNGRRVSRDKIVTQDLILNANGNTIWIKEYSKKLFESLGELPQNVKVFEDANEICRDGLIFVENTLVSDFEELVEAIIIYNWNREYPSSLKFDIALDNWNLLSEEEFEGNSHEKITKTVYVREANI